MAREIPLTRGYVALVDDQDYARVVAVGPWHVNEAGNQRYARHWYRDQFDIQRFIGIHNLIAGELLVDHVNGDGLDNRRVNLRPATATQNAANKGAQSNNRSGFKGVNFYPRTGRWRAFIGGIKQKHLGYFATAHEAAAAYDIAAIERWGEFAQLNFPLQEMHS